MAKIKEIHAREILNGRGIITIECTVVLTDGSIGIASSPSGTSVGSYEAVENHDKDNMRFQGNGMLKAIESIPSVIAPKLIGMDANSQQEIDNVMISLDGTQNKGKFGANTLLSISMAVAKAAAASSVLPLFLYLRQFIDTKSVALRIPTPLFTMINGGLLGENTIDFQDFMIIPSTSKTYIESLQIGTQIHSLLRNTMITNGLSPLVGLAGGYGPKVGTNYEALTLLMQSIDSSMYRLGYDIFMGIDAAANNFYRSQQYHIKDKLANLPSEELLAFYEELMREFHLLYLEDIYSEDDWDSWIKGAEVLSKDLLVAGDDLIASNPYRLQMAIGKKAIGALCVSPNKMGTVIESLAIVSVARAAGLKIVVSSRSGETNDDFIADFAVAVGADYVKFGGLSRGEHVIKYNRLLEINEKLKVL